MSMDQGKFGQTMRCEMQRLRWLTGAMSQRAYEYTARDIEI